MVRSEFSYLWWLTVLLFMSAGCAVSIERITFSILRPPDIPLAPESKVLLLGFAGEDVALASRLDGLFMQGLRADTTVILIEPREALRVLSRWGYTTGTLSDSLAVAVGKAVGADIVVAGKLERRYTEVYGEEKKYQVVEAFRPAGNAMQIRLDTVPYYEPYINQIADLRSVLRLISLKNGVGQPQGAVRSVDTLHVVLPAPVQKPPKGAVVVDRITPALVDRALSTLADRLVGLFVGRMVVLSRSVYHRPDDAEGLTAIRTANWGEAQRFWERLTQEKPDNAAAWNNLAIVYEAMGLPEEARKAYRKALTLAPRDTTILRNSREVP